MQGGVCRDGSIDSRAESREVGEPLLPPGMKDGAVTDRESTKLIHHGHRLPGGGRWATILTHNPTYSVRPMRVELTQFCHETTDSLRRRFVADRNEKENALETVADEGDELTGGPVITLLEDEPEREVTRLESCFQQPP